MPNTSRLLPEHIVCKITQRDNIRRANPCDLALKPLNHEITSDTNWDHTNWDHKHNTHTLWKTIHGFANRAAPTQNCTITFHKKIATSPKNIVNCCNTVKHSTLRLTDLLMSCSMFISYPNILSLSLQPKFKRQYNIAKTTIQ